MYNLVRFIPVIVFACMVSACATQPFNHIDLDARSHFESVDAYLVVPQDEIYADIERSQSAAMMGGGLLFALIDASVDNSRSKTAEDLIQPLRDQLIDFDFAEILTEKINAKLTNVDWLNASELVLERAAAEDQLSSKYKTCDASAILWMHADYKLSPDFKAVTTRVNLMMFATIEELKAFREKVDDNENPVDRADNIYRNVITVSIPMDVTGKKEENAVALTKDNCVMVKNALEACAAKVAAKIHEDIIKDETADLPQKEVQG